MRLSKALGTLVIMQLLMGTTVYAQQHEFANQDKKNWDRPAEGNLEAFHVDGRYLATTSQVQWNADQIGLTSRKFFLPALSYTSDRSDILQPKLMLSTLPGAKFKRSFVDESRGVSVQVTSYDAEALQADQAYTFFTAWGFIGSSKSNPVVTLQSVQRLAQPGHGYVNDLPGSEDWLNAIEWQEAADVDSRESGIPIPENQDTFYSSVESSVYQNGKEQSYAGIDSKQTLEQYKSAAAKRVHMLWDTEEVPFAITFEGSISPDVRPFTKEYNAEIHQIYGEGVTEKRGNVHR
ncbi:hypothetical protein [Paenibacillus hexagrammi]|uniref:Uncharacterized protein n=1 Tax=Paenibacillus hexagrammi TaxID=2908839 RepID=A0ABY3SJL2_9BACL|nr:hypothetical protein [Paenibacillus sp. YPD9-1]UJF34008.1 hypothetical protein L0M14_01855 [Paenibacillus sp. YPD9-1]